MFKIPHIDKVKSTAIPFSFVLALGALTACTADDFNFFTETSYSSETASVPSEIKDVRMPASIVVCRAKQCSPTSSNMSKEFLYNAFYNLLENNVHTDALVCDADSASHTCFEPFVSFNMTAGVTPTNVVIDAVRVLEIGIKKENFALEPILNYSIYNNGIRTKCSPAVAATYVKDPNYMVVEGEKSSCEFTALGKSELSTLLAVDYIDLDYGLVGGYYSVGVSGSAYGGGSGYMLLRFENPVSPEVLCQQQKGACEAFKPKLPEYDCCGGYGRGGNLNDVKRPPEKGVCRGCSPSGRGGSVSVSPIPPKSAGEE